VRFLLPPSIGKTKANARAEVLAEELGGFLGTRVRVDVAADYAALARSVEELEVDLGWAPPVLCARLWPAAHFILKAMRGGRTAYRSALVGRASEPLRVDALQGRRAVWVDPMSTGGHLLAVAHLRRQGCDPDRTLAVQSFAGSYRDALLAVVAGSADLTAVYTAGEDHASVRQTLARLVGGLEERLRAFAFTDEAPSDGLVLTRRMSAPAAGRLSSTLVSRPPALLLEACEAEAFVVARPGDYHALVM
jgi:two-component system, NtrC family, sensor kinase